jgi:lysophospholipase L1-like esterase
MDYKCIGLLGDSIGQGYFSDNNEGWFGKYINMLNKENPKKYSYQNMSVDGERVTDVYHRLYSEALTKEIDVLFIAIGTNDTVRWGSKETPMDISEGLREEMWRKILPVAKRNIEKVFVVSLLPVIEERFPAIGAGDRELYHLAEDIINYNRFLKELCVEYDIPFIDLTEKWIKNNPKELLFDSSHPNDKGHQIIANEVFEKTKNIVM